jgi:hypothetical protein
MLNKKSHINACQNNSGQNAIEYILVFVLVLGVIVVALGPGGRINTSVNESLDLSVQSIENVLTTAWP